MRERRGGGWADSLKDIKRDCEGDADGQTDASLRLPDKVSKPFGGKVLKIYVSVAAAVVEEWRVSDRDFSQVQERTAQAPSHHNTAGTETL